MDKQTLENLLRGSGQEDLDGEVEKSLSPEAALRITKRAREAYSRRFQVGRALTHRHILFSLTAIAATVLLTVSLTRLFPRTKPPGSLSAAGPNSVADAGVDEWRDGGDGSLISGGALYEDSETNDSRQSVFRQTLPVVVELRVNGSRQERWQLDLNDDGSFSIFVQNRGDDDLEVHLAVDGISLYHFGGSNSPLVLKGGQQTTVSGWPLSNNDIEPFLSPGEEFSRARDLLPANHFLLGTVLVTFRQVGDATSSQSCVLVRYRRKSEFNRVMR